MVDLDASGRAAWDRNADMIKRLARIETLTDVAAAPKGSVTIPVQGGLFALPLEGIIDVAAERAGWTRPWASLKRTCAASTAV